MKKLFTLFSIIFLAFFCATCKKDSVDKIPIGTLKVDIDGVEKPFSIQAKATRLQVTGGYGIQIKGNYRTGSTTDLTLTIVQPGSVTKGSYTENTNDNPLVTIKHCIEVISPCVFRYESKKIASNPVNITITEITSSFVRGTFKGTLTDVGGTNNQNFTNGVFYVSF